VTAHLGKKKSECPYPRLHAKRPERKDKALGGGKTPLDQGQHQMLYEAEPLRNPQYGSTYATRRVKKCPVIDSDISSNQQERSFHRKRSTELP